ncbi:MAG: type IV toxin-antitoxin system AbiEi family antitoxin domain-containing protein [Atopobiaceae bacterium]|nr:type IV toxin-antitoxin system AbiEi family antitoxin domain-containing protein [Atopobiaceae bacterium]
MIVSYNTAMSRESHISTIAELVQSEGGVFTAAQAARLGVPRDALSHAMRAGRLERVVRGAYRLVGTAPSELDLAAALWKLTAPASFTHERMGRWDGIVVGGATAAFALGIGDLHPYPCRMYAPHLIRSKFPGMSAAVRRVDERDVTFRFGTPVTRAERTVLDLSLDGEDPSLVANVLAGAERRLSRADFDHARLAELFVGSVGRWGVPAGTLEVLAAETGVDVTMMEIGGQA